MQDATNNCQKIQELLSAYRDLELAEEENAQVKLHLGACDECTREANAIEAVAATLLQVPRVSMKSDMADKLEALIAAQVADTSPAGTEVEEGGPKVVSFRKRLVWGSLAAAAAAAVLLVAVPIFTSNNQVADNSVKQVAPVKEEAPQQPLVANDSGAAQMIANEVTAPTQVTAADESTAPSPNAVATSGSVQEVRKIEKPEVARNKTAAAVPVVATSQTAPKAVRERTIDATLDTINETEALVAFSSDDNLFEDCGISTDEDGLYAIKL